MPAAFAYRLPADVADVELAPLLCAGIIGYRALLRASLPEHGRLGLYGFGDSAHLVAQVALAQGATVHALTRGETSQRLALELGAASARGAYDSLRNPWTARSCSRRSGTRAGRDAGTRPWRSPRRCRDPSDRHTAAEL